MTQAQEAKVKTEEAKIDEQRKLASLEAVTNLENKPYTDKKGDTAIIPAGFAITGIEGEDTIKDGLVITDSEGNEFVWIPVTDSSSYVRNPEYANGLTLEDDSDYLPEGITSESENVTKAKRLLYLKI